jgi:Clostridium epsilon toxin ETX/Bacillus mosquitocidal toxin MTX2
MSDDDQRNTLITENDMHSKSKITWKELQGMTNHQLVQVGLEWFAKSKTIAGIKEFKWDIDHAKIVSNVPDNIATETYNNTSEIDEAREFSYTKVITNTSTFSHEHGFEVATGMQAEFKAGIPVAKTTWTVGIDITTSHNWSLGEENSASVTYERKSTVTVPPGKKIKCTASITRCTLDVPYSAKIVKGDGSEQWISGTWKGVSTIDLVENQMDIKD